MSLEAPADWISTTLGEQIVEMRGGGTPSRKVPEYWNGNIPWASVKDLKGRHIDNTEESISEDGLQNCASSLIPKGTLVLATRMAVGKAVRFSRDVAINQDLRALFPRPSLDVDFLHQWFSWQESHVARLGSGTTVAGIRQETIRGLPLALPLLQEQRRIAEILSSVDEAIAATRAVIEQTKKVKQGVLERLLTKGIGHTRFKQTEIGEIPEGWRTGKIGDFFTLQRGFDITEKQSTVGEYPVVSSSGISYFHWEAMVRGPAVITGRKGKLGQVYFIDSSCWPHDTTLWVKDFKGNAPKFVYWFLRSLNLEKFDAATAVPTLNRNVVHALGCAFPPISEQLLIADHLDSIEATEDTQTRNLASYGQTKSALMADLLTGRKRVTDALPMAAE